MIKIYSDVHGSHSGLLLFIAAGIAGLLTAPSASAQGNTGKSLALEEIVVTAQRREQDLQSTPVTISALSADIAEAKGVSRTSDLQIVVPGLVYADSGIAPGVYLRGVGTQDTSAGQESSTPLYVDGVYYSHLPASFTSFNNIERVEVLKGPQGTLFGRNSTGGLLQIITRQPSSETSFEASLTAANYSTFGVQLYAAGGLSDNVAADIAASYEDQGDGWGTNFFNGQDVYEGNSYAVRTKLLWTPSDATEVVLSADISEREDSSTSGAIDFPALGAFTQQPHTGGFFDINAELRPLERASNDGVSITIRHDLSRMRFTSITAYRSYELASDFDQDREAIAGVVAIIRDEGDQLTQELQLQSLPSSNLQWITGLFYMDAEADLTSFELSGLAIAGGGPINLATNLQTTSTAAYAQVTWPLTDRTNLTAGARYTSDDRDFVAPLFGLDTGESWDETTWRVAIDHSVSEDVMFYASASTGFKSGAYNTFNAANPAIDPEEITAYEVGMKAEFLDNRLRLNIAPFYYDYEDIQLVQAVQATTFIFNAAKATIRGLDVQIVAAVTDGLTLDASFGFLDSEYDSFPGAPSTVPNVGTCDPEPTFLGPRAGGNLNCTFDASGSDLIRAPDLTMALGARYAWNTSAGDFSVSANYFHSGDFNYEPNGRLQQDSYGVLNAQFGWRSANRPFGVRLWARNLTDEEYYTNRISSVTDTYAAAAPLTYGITFDFGQ